MEKVRFIEQGKILCTHGVRGEVKLEVWCGDYAAFEPVGHLYLSKDGGQRLTIKSKRPAGQYVLCSFEGLDTVETVAKYKGLVFYADRAELPEREGRMMICDMIGLPVIDNESGSVYGTLSSVDEYPASDVYVVLTPNGEEVQVPDVPQFIKKLSEDGIFISAIEGMFE